MEEISWITNNIDKLTLLTWPAVALLLAFIFRDSIKTYINFYINKKQGNGTDLVKRFNALEQTANHEHSAQIDGIKEDLGQIRKDISHLSIRIEGLSDRVSRIEGRINGGFYPK